MPGYQLTDKALREIFGILEWLRLSSDPLAANRTEDMLFAAFSRLGERTAIGHRRPDITDKNLLFYTARPYLIVLRERAAGIQILHVVHGSLDLRRIL